jgi:hypothetical protein
MMTAFILPAEMSLAAPPPAQTPSLGNSFLCALGIGDSDIYYPREFEGIWNCYSTLTAVDTPQVPDLCVRKMWLAYDGIHLVFAEGASLSTAVYLFNEFSMNIHPVDSK